MSNTKHTPNREHGPLNRARMMANAMRQLGVEPTVSRLMRSIRDLQRSEAEAVVAEYRAAIAKATGSAQ